jgi:hypothetical protein
VTSTASDLPRASARSADLYDLWLCRIRHGSCAEMGICLVAVSCAIVTPLMGTCELGCRRWGSNPHGRDPASARKTRLACGRI